MNSRELMDALLRKKGAPRMALFDSPWPETLVEWTKQGYPTDENGDPVDPTYYFGFDMTQTGGWFDILPIEGYNKVIQETDEWEIRENGAGAKLKWWKYKCGTPEHVDFRMTTREIWENEYKPHLKATPTRVDMEEARTKLATAREKGVFAFYGNLGFWEAMRESLGDVCMFETLIDDPDWILDFNRTYTDFFKDQYEILFKEVGLPDGIWLYDDLAYKNGPFCNPRTLRELYFPFYKEMADYFHSYDLPVVFHCCGREDQVIPIIADAGYDALNPMERKAGCDPVKFAKQYGDRLAFVGGLNAMTLESGDRAQIEKEVLELVNGMREAGASYIFGSDHSLSPNIKLADFQFAVDCYRKYAAY